MSPAALPHTGEDRAGDAQAIAALRTLAEGRFGRRVAEVHPLAGDASERRYVRLRHPGGAPATSIGMIHAAPFDPAALPFLNVAAHFSCLGLPVPEVYATGGGAGVVLLEDGGDRLLEEVWNREGWAGAGLPYREAVEVLAALQAAPLDGPPGALAVERAFDAALFLRELHHTRRFAFAALLGMEAPEATFAGPFEALAQALCRLPFCIAHRDFHARNLLVREGGGLMVLDFQDARLGPATYDPASLLFDSYVPLPRERREALAAACWEKSGRRFFPDEAAFAEALALTGLQRNLKAIGTFAYQKTRLGNPFYLKYIPPTAAAVRRHLGALPAWPGLGDRLHPFLERLERREEEPSR